MKTKNKILFALVICAILTLTASTVFAQGEEPPAPLSLADFPWLQALLTAAVTFVITAGIKSFGEVFKVDITGKATAITAAAVLFVIEISNTLLALVPPDAAPIVTALFGFIATLLAAFGYAGLIKKRKQTPQLTK